MNHLRILFLEWDASNRAFVSNGPLFKVNSHTTSLRDGGTKKFRVSEQTSIVEKQTMNDQKLNRVHPKLEQKIAH